MKKLVLSRKGFDSVAGGKPSPVFPDGSLFSLPIPTKYHSPYKYADIVKQKMTGIEALEQVGANKISPDSACHYDPILQPNTGLFGQVGKVQGELDKHNINAGDLFLFFGWFRDFSSYPKKDVHHIFGWLEIEHIIKGTSKIEEYCRTQKIPHPHAVNDYQNNTLYIGKKSSSFSKSNHSVNGFGEFIKTDESLILTEEGRSRSHWKMPTKFFSETQNPHLFSNRLKWNGDNDNRIQCKGYGQEFIIDIDKNPSAFDWAQSLILSNT